MAAAAIFDMDGTLVTFRFDVRGTRRAILEELEAMDFDTHGLDLTTPTQKILDAARAQARAPAAYSRLRESVFRILDRFEIEAALTATPFPGTEDVLGQLRSEGVRMAVLTNSGRVAATKSMEKAGLLEFFEFVLTRDDTETMKPSPEGLAQAADRLGLSPDRTFYVGDSPFDIMAARGAGVRVVSVTTGNYDASQLRKEGADLVISSLAELPPILGV